MHNGTFDSTKYLSDLIGKIESHAYDFSTNEMDLVAGLNQVLHETNLLKELDFREIGDHINDGIYISDGNEKTLYVNKAYSRITGIKPEEVLGRYVSDLVKDGLYKFAVTPEVIKLKKQVNSIGESLRNGTKMLISGDPIFDGEGNVKKVVATNREITELLAMQAELEASQKKIKDVEADKNKGMMEIEHLRKLNQSSGLIGRSPEIQQVVTLIHQITGLEVTVLITGETGVGKEVVANEIYSQSTRKNGSFIKVNCAAIPANLLESELFGYEKGSFTGASSVGKIGLFGLADKGTILLDEIGDMPIELQSKLLRVIQHKEITRVGGRAPVKLDVRIIAATNCDLLDLVKQGKFREDLFYRLNVFPIFIPPLRLRIDDIEVLTEHFLKIYNAEYNKQVRMERSGFDILKKYSWPGNIRELQNIVERLVIVSSLKSIVSSEQIRNLLNLDLNILELSNEKIGLREIVEDVEKKTIEKTLLLYGSTRRAAAILGIDHSTIVKKAKKMGIIMRTKHTN
jgi:PAS domain S-box-containing protein